VLKKVILFAALLTIPSGAYAAHPLITDDTGTQGNGRFQLEINTEFSIDESNADGVPYRETTGEIAATLTCGLSKNIDLVVGMPYQWYTSEESGFTTAEGDGIADMSLELKWRFFDTGEKGMSFALKPGISIPVGSEEKGFGTGAVSCGAMLIATYTGTSGALHMNLGYSRINFGTQKSLDTSRQNIWHASVAGEFNLT
jgi:hypothetical protein